MRKDWSFKNRQDISADRPFDTEGGTQSKRLLKDIFRYPYETSSVAEWLQEALQKSCKSAGLQQSQIWATVESPLAAINSTFAALQKIPESRSALQSGFEKTKNVVAGNGLPFVSTKKRNAGSDNTIIMIHGRGVDKALVAE